MSQRSSPPGDDDRGDEGVPPGASIDDLLGQIRKRDSAMQKREAELEAVNKELAAFSYSVSHDLRSPLRSIEGFSEALAEDYQDRLDDQGRDYLRRIRAAVARMEQLIDDLLALARVSRGELLREQVDLSAIAESIAAELKASGPERNVTFSIEPCVMVEGDSRLLRIVLENLLGNSWKFTRNHPVATIELGSEEKDGHRIFHVRDDGAGFDPTYAGTMFGAFQRFHGATEFEGNGIGLAMVQRIVRRHGGDVWAEGEVEKGAKVSVALECTGSSDRLNVMRLGSS